MQPIGSASASTPAQVGSDPPPDATAWDRGLDATLGVLDTAGLGLAFIPVVGTVGQAAPDLLAAGIRFARGDTRGGQWSLICAIPVAGDLVGGVAKMPKFAQWLSRVAPGVADALRKTAKTVTQAGKAEKPAAQAAEAAGHAAKPANVVPLFKDAEHASAAGTGKAAHTRKTASEAGTKATQAQELPTWANKAVRVGKNLANRHIGRTVANIVDLAAPMSEAEALNRVSSDQRARHKQTAWALQKMGLDKEALPKGREGLRQAVERAEAAQVHLGKVLQGRVAYGEGEAMQPAEFPSVPSSSERTLDSSGKPIAAGDTVALRQAQAEEQARIEALRQRADAAWKQVDEHFGW